MTITIIVVILKIVIIRIVITIIITIIPVKEIIKMYLKTMIYDFSALISNFLCNYKNSKQLSRNQDSIIFPFTDADKFHLRTYT